MTDQEYWDLAATDPEVDEIYIANVDLGECLKAIKPALKPGRLLEIGSGVGRLTIPLSRPTMNKVVGVDISPAMRRIAAQRALEANVTRCRFIDVDTFYKLESKSFDGAFSMVTFQHIGPNDLRRYFKEIGRLLKRGAPLRFQFVEGNHHSPQNHNYTEEQITAMAQNAGLDIVDTERGLILQNWTWITAIKEGTT